MRPPTHSVPTSVAAAASLEGHYDSIMVRMESAFKARGQEGYTDEEVATELGLGPNSHRAARIDLERSGRVVRTQQRRRTRSGREAIVFMHRSAFTNRERRS